MIREMEEYNGSRDEEITREGWPAVAARKAHKLEVLDDVCRRLDAREMARRCQRLAGLFRRSGEEEGQMEET